ncbi:MAG: hypothetical protein AAF717_20530 [Bacteroidota bacterium]
MEISRELLKKYALGTCTDLERKAVENWLSLDEGYNNDEYVELFESRKDIIQKRIYKRLWPLETRFWDYTKKGLRYSAAACILLVTFLGGRVSANSASTESVKITAQKERLYVYGGKKLRADFSGERFKIKFKGTVQLYNASQQAQAVVTGDSTFILVPYRFYYLNGSSSQPTLLTERPETMGNDSGSLTVDEFSILKIE